MSDHRPLEDHSPGAAWEALEASIGRVTDALGRVPEIGAEGDHERAIYERAALEGALSNLLAARLVAAELREIELTIDIKLEWLAEALTRAIQRP